MKILIVKMSALGDIIHTFPSIAYLREKFPDAQIDWVVEKRCSELIHAHPFVDQVFEIDSKKWRKSWREMMRFRKKMRQRTYDVIFDFQGNIKSAAVLFCAKGKKRVGFGWRCVPEWPNALFTNVKVCPEKENNIREDYLELVQRYFGDPTPYEAPSVLLIADPLPVLPAHTLVCPWAAWKNKRLPPVKLIPFLKTLDKGPYQFLWGTDDEKERAKDLAAHFPGSSLVPRLNLPQLQHLMANVPLVVSMDSLPLHLAATTETRTISFFGPSSLEKYAPKGKRHIAVQGSCPFGMCFEKRCSKLRTCETGACLLEGIETEKAACPQPDVCTRP